ncbi:MAG: [FeFe] hydrogenase H-cluster maturation GTPase HydF [Ruminococcaceae bacterium]|nr:[FeFe] hydrogenase H-cluster maturation GTPase HydF [Oscillospiraceae bacterium]
MSLNETVSAERVHIGFFGMRNAGKSSLVNAVTGQSLSVVSDVLGTTTDPVKKAMELLPLGPVVIIDTPGFDDEGYLGEKRVEKTNEILAKTDVAILVVDSLKGLTKGDEELIEAFKKRNIPYIIAFNKCELLTEKAVLNDNEIYVSTVANINIFELKEKIGSLSKATEKKKYVVSDLVEKGDIVVLVIPIDEAAPKGRLILPQQMTIRDLLDGNCTVVACQDTELESTLQSLAKKPKLVITDSQIFGKVSKIVPDDILLTSFSILMARYKGELDMLIKGAERLSQIKNGDKILISEGCTHHRQCNDIGTVKIPNWVREYTKAEPEFSFTSGGEFPQDLREFSLIVHCGGCTLNEKEMKHRVNLAREQGVPMVNYGVAIAKMTNILERSVQIMRNAECGVRN